MKTQDNKYENFQGPLDGFKPLTEDDEQHISGGGAAALTIQCAQGEHWDVNQRCCVSDSTPNTAAVSNS